MSYIPEYFGNNFRMFFLDDIQGTAADNSDRNVLIIQGVNILGTAAEHSVVYSRRGVELGGGLLKTDDEVTLSGRGKTTRNVNNGTYGMCHGSSPYHGNYYATTARYSQIIYNTDIVLRTPNGTSTPRSSRIYDATLPYDGVYRGIKWDNSKGVYSDAYDISTEANKWFNPTVKIIGGHMFVGAGQTLQIDGGRINYNPTLVDGIPLYKYDKAGNINYVITQTMTVSPSSLTVERDGIVNIGKPVYRNYGETTDAYTASPYKNVTTDMFVNGKVNLTTGAWAGGNAVVGNGGVFTMAANARYEGDIHVTRDGVLTLGDSSVYTGDVVVDSGVMTMGGNAQYNGNIYVASGGALTIGSSIIVGDIQIEHGGSITINAGAKITGDVRCAGEMEIKGNFTLNYSPASEDIAENPITENIKESTVVDGKYIYHGIFIYSDPDIGPGKLTLPATGAPVINGTSGGIHAFTGYSALPYDDGDHTFCNDRSYGNACRHWTTTSDVWHKQGDSSDG
jgi:hypothetical protein